MRRKNILIGLPHLVKNSLAQGMFAEINCERNHRERIVGVEFYLHIQNIYIRFVRTNEIREPGGFYTVIKKGKTPTLHM